MDCKRLQFHYTAATGPVKRRTQRHFTSGTHPDSDGTGSERRFHPTGLTARRSRGTRRAKKQSRKKMPALPDTGAVPAVAEESGTGRRPRCPPAGESPTCTPRRRHPPRGGQDTESRYRPRPTRCRSCVRRPVGSGTGAHMACVMNVRMVSSLYGVPRTCRYATISGARNTGSARAAVRQRAASRMSSRHPTPRPYESDARGTVAIPTARPHPRTHRRPPVPCGRARVDA